MPTFEVERFELVSATPDTALLRLAGVAQLNVEGVGAARPASGITKEKA